MKWIARFFGLLFALAGTAAAAFAVWLCMTNLNSIPVLLAPVDEAEEKAAPHPRHDPSPDPRRPASPRPGRAPGALPTFTTGSR